MNWDSILAYPLQDLPFVALVLIIAFTVHEFAHAYSAYKFGDNTAYDAGRVTLNPRVHIDWLGAILILIAGFGWAKPVPVNQSRFKHPRLMGVVVSAVGPLSNLVIGIIGLVLLFALDSSGVLANSSRGVSLALTTFLGYLISLNFLLFVFNLIPLPPLDGYRIIQDLVPLKVRYKMDQNVQWGVFFFLIIVFVPPLRRVTLDPVLGMISPLIDFFASIIRPMFY
ncbi:site-2 protease family protein [Paenibacillus radicis (ex Gao et al. 2016)]|uniref:Zinc metalloprotease n=1 Tax=Paenibacillus radicis (ex Gao et al. 2016) TaxID=1737354 RepID=A0A917GSI6_9BACL|nr:site-2 protease family protein [Paenibacillus radicis (ex Gao et al. 2016)]GGG56144.1 zinc metalloprotease [Paenibacillus radicis (ex Gao et al. 2016)]